MTATGAVLAPLVTAFVPDTGPALIVLAGLMAALGLLFGFLATERHLRWSVVASAVIVASLASGWITPSPAKASPPTPTPAPSLALLIVPPVALVLFSAVGAWILHRKAGGRARSPDE